LSEEQALALEHIQRGCNVFITGIVSTGKSLVLKKALEFLSHKYPPNKYVMVAPTGSIAITLEGQTLHSFAGIGGFQQIAIQQKHSQTLEATKRDGAG
jgi:ATP-dependent DNA helicase PIF1